MVNVKGHKRVIKRQVINVKPHKREVPESKKPSFNKDNMKSMKTASKKKESSSFRDMEREKYQEKKGFKKTYEKTNVNNTKNNYAIRYETINKIEDKRFGKIPIAVVRIYPQKTWNKNISQKEFLESDYDIHRVEVSVYDKSTKSYLSQHHDFNSKQKAIKFTKEYVIDWKF